MVFPLIKRPSGAGIQSDCRHGVKARAVPVALAAWAYDDLHDLAIRRCWFGVDHFTAGKECSGARDDVVDLGDVLVHDGADRGPGC
jgi:hypothetical protein